MIRFIVFIAVFFSIYGLANLYIGIRGWQLLVSFIPYVNKKVYWVLFWFVAVAFIFGRLGSRILPSSINDLMNLIGSYWMAIMVYSILLLLVLDVTRLIARLFGFKPALMTFTNQKSSLYIGVALFLIITGIIVWGTINAVNVKISHYDIYLSKKAGQADNLRIAMISDTHLGNIVTNERLGEMVKKINSLNPDLVLLVGDTIDDNIEPYIKQNMAETFLKIKSRLGVYAVLGIHEFYGSKADDIVRNYEKGGIKVLRDQFVEMNGFYLVGREDFTNKNRKPLKELLNGMTKSLPVILMDHQPSKLDEPQKAGIDLQVSGHTHGGQLFPGSFINNYIYERNWGYLRKGDFQLIVSSGAGTWGPPIRTGSISEIVDINVRFVKE